MTEQKVEEVSGLRAGTSYPGVKDLAHEAMAMRLLSANVIDATDIGTHAVEYALNNWAVFPLNGKIPAIAGGRGVLDATINLDTVVGWWGGRYVGANIGGRVPNSMIVLDTDPRNGGDESFAALEGKNGKLPRTLMTVSGRGDGGRHLFYRRPPGNLSSRRLGPGIDLKTAAGYVVLPPSIHPDSGKPYLRVDAPVAAPPPWLIQLLQPEPQPKTTPAQRRPPGLRLSGGSIADTFSTSTSWSEILEPHGWRCLDSDPDADGARWRHPTATSPWSATIKNGCLFVYSTNTPFESTQPSDPHGYTRFRAYAVLDHLGDMSGAARYLSRKSVSR